MYMTTTEFEELCHAIWVENPASIINLYKLPTPVRHSTSLLLISIGYPASPSTIDELKLAVKDRLVMRGVRCRASASSNGSWHKTKTLLFASHRHQRRVFRSFQIQVEVLVTSSVHHFLPICRHPPILRHGEGVR